MTTYLKFCITCNQCGEKSTVIGDTIDGQKLLRSRKTMTPARVTWSEDPMFDEVGDISGKAPRISLSKKVEIL